MQKYCSVGPLECIFIALSKIGSLCSLGGTRTFIIFYGYVGPLECIFIAPLALSNEGVRAHFFHLMEAPIKRLQNVKNMASLAF